MANGKQSKNKPPIWKRKYLVQKGYQLRYSFLIAAIGAFALILAFYVIRYIVYMDLLPLTIPNISLFKVALFMFVSWFFLGVIYTHTTAGPITQLINQINNIALNKLEEARVTFRRGDDLQDLPEYFNNMVKVLKFRETEEIMLLKDLKNNLKLFKEKTVPAEQHSELLNSIQYTKTRIDNLIMKKQRYLGPEEERVNNLEKGQEEVNNANS